MTPLRLHLGCGEKRLPGFVNCDMSAEVKPDMVVDVLHLSKKFKPNSVDEIFTEHTIEHVIDFEGAMREIHRVLRPGGIARIIVPYATIPSAFHPHHRWYFTMESFSPLAQGDVHQYYYDFHFSQVRSRLVFHPLFSLISGLANGKPGIYENSFLAWLFPAKELHVVLTK